MNELSISPAMDRRNGLLFTVMYAAIFLAAPVSYVGVVQAALCIRLGSDVTLANLPSATYLLGGIAPLFLALLIPHRLERSVVVWANGITAALILVVFLALVTHLPPSIPLAVLVVQGLLQGISATTAQVFVFQCLARGTTLDGRNRAFQRTYFVSPICAVLGSLAAQHMLNGGMSRIAFPFDFALLYLLGFACMTLVTVCSALFELAPIPDEPRKPLGQELRTCLTTYFRSPPLRLLFCVYTLWYCALNITPNLAVFAQHALGHSIKDVSGITMAVRFGCKSIGGYALGAIALRYGIRMSVIACSLLLVAGILWGWIVPGYMLFLAFGLLGAGELGGAYIPNFGVALSTPASTAQNLSILTLASPVSAFSPALFGVLADHYGFGASFACALLMAGAAIFVTMQIGQTSNANLPPVAEEDAP